MPTYSETIYSILDEDWQVLFGSSGLRCDIRCALSLRGGVCNLHGTRALYTLVKLTILSKCRRFIMSGRS